MTGAELKAAIAALGCNQRDFAAHVGVSAAHLSRMCHDTYPVPVWLALIVAEWGGPQPVNPPPRVRAL